MSVLTEDLKAVFIKLATLLILRVIVDAETVVNWWDNQGLHQGQLMKKITFL